MLPVIYQYFVDRCLSPRVIQWTVKKYKTLGQFCESLYLAGIITGLHDLHGDELNHFLDLLIEDMAESWEQGICFNHTALHFSGWIVRSAITCMVCDLPAAWKTMQILGPRSYFYCSVCSCCNLKTLRRTDFNSEFWKLQDKDILWQQAEAYKNAGSAQLQEKLFAKHGVHWSPLWKLPYWDPAWQLVIHVMHCILEGITTFYIHDVLHFTTVEAYAWEITPSAFNYPGSIPGSANDYPLTKKDIKQVREIQSLLVASMEGNGQAEQIGCHINLLTKQLNLKIVLALKIVAEDLHCQLHTQGRIFKVQWIKALIE